MMIVIGPSSDSTDLRNLNSQVTDSYKNLKKVPTVKEIGELHYEPIDMVRWVYTLPVSTPDCT